MTASHDDIAAALQRLRAAVRDQISRPPAGDVRARAIRAVRVRRTATAALAAAAVAAVAIGGAQVARPDAGPPVPPAGTTSPSGTPTAPPGPEVTPSPRPAPRPAQALDDPIAEVDWSSATILVPPREGCPTGPVTLVPAGEADDVGTGPDGLFPRIQVSADSVAYGDLTGDGRAEAVLEASCAPSEEGLGSGHGSQLLVVTRVGDGTLIGVDWAGPPGAFFASWWVDGGRLLVDADPWTAGPDDHFPAVPGLALSYRRVGNQLQEWEVAPEYPPIAPLDPGQPPPPVHPRAVAAGLGCPDDELRFVAEPSGGLWTASRSGATYAVPALPFQQYLFDLDNTGIRLLVTALECVHDDGTTTSGLAVFEPDGDGWRGISVLRRPDGASPASWTRTADGLAVTWSGDDTAAPYRWTGTLLVPGS